MLVLSRRIGEAIVLDCGGVTIRVMPIRVTGGDHIRLGFEAPPEVLIRREELLGGIWTHESAEPLEAVA